MEQNKIEAVKKPYGFIKPVASVLATQVILMICYAANGIITARFLGPEGKGIDTLCMMIPSFGFLFFSLNLQGSLTYLAGKNYYAPSVLLSYMLYIVLFISMLAGIVYFVFPKVVLGRIIPSFPDDLWFLVGILFATTLLSNLVSGLLLGWHRIGPMNVQRIMQSVSAVVLMILMFEIVQASVFIAVVAVIVGIIATNIFILRQIHSTDGISITKQIPRSLVGDSLSFGIRGYAGNLFQFFNYRIDVFLVNYFLAPAQLGFYSVAVSIAELLWYLPNSIASILFSHIANDGDRHSIDSVSQIFRITWVLVVLGSVVLAIIGKQLISWMFGPAFAVSYTAMLWLLPGVITLSMSKVMTGYFSGKGEPQFGSISSAGAFLVTIVGNFLLIPRLGIDGAAITSSISYSVGAAIVLYYFLKRTPLSMTSLFVFRKSDMTLAISSLRRLFV